jgi:hypothetical protein
MTGQVRAGRLEGFSKYRVWPDGTVESSRMGPWKAMKGCRRVLRGHTYRAYFLTDDSGRFRYRYGHDLVALAFMGPTPPGKEVCFRNGDRSDCRLENLYFGKADRRRKKRLTVAEEAEGGRLHEGLMRDIQAVPAWGVDVGGDSGVTRGAS